MSEMTANRIVRSGTLAVAALVWCIAAWLLTRTSVPSLDTSGFDQHAYFTQHAIDRAARYGRGADGLWLAGPARDDRRAARPRAPAPADDPEHGARAHRERDRRRHGVARHAVVRPAAVQ